MGQADNGRDYFHVEIDDEARVAPTASIVGDVRIARDVTLFSGVAIRGDYGESVTIGERSNVQENSCLHVDRGCPTVVGKDVIIGHGALVHGCTIDDHVLIGMGAIIMNGAHVGQDACIGAGAVVTEHTEIPERGVAVGIPAKCVRLLTDAEVEKNRGDAQHYVEIGKRMERDGLMVSGASLRAAKGHGMPTISLSR